ncbi:ATP-binding protein [Saccharopolyspora taberi]|uniref:Helicase HerA central domain-containing protein n=1 Tax=Saccharopolyspora taberi TaxID=60895 RepID=A0ABN3V890_9PSEU
MTASTGAASSEGLRLAEDFTMPVDMVTSTFAILGKKGRGKTHCASVLTEEMIREGVPTCILDPTGAWWGLRSSADGTAPGLPVVIFGGEHCDVDLPETSGTIIADVLIEQRFPAVLDMSLLSKSARRRFATEFLERLYWKNRLPLHLCLDEADEIAPQRAHAGVERLLGATEDAVRRGRIRGLGITLISQRAAALSKSVLSQVDSLIVLGMTAPHDISAVDAWVGQHAEEAQAHEVKATLPALPVGEAWVWSPEWLGVLRRVHVRARTTFDSSATPKTGQVRLQPKQWAQVDVAALAYRLADAEQKGAETDPRRLRARVRDLERQLAAASEPPPPREIEVEVPVVTEEQTAELDQLVGRLEQVAQASAESAQALAEALGRARPPAHDAAPAAPAAEPEADAESLQAPSSEVTPTPTSGNGGLGKAEREILVALAQHGPRTRTQVALLTRRSHRSGGFRNALSRLRTAGLVEGRGEIAITEAGRTMLGGAWQPLPTGSALLEWWCRTLLGRAERTILTELVRCWPDEVSVDELAARTGYSRASGGFRNALSRLRSLELASGRGSLRAADTLAE